MNSKKENKILDKKDIEQIEPNFDKLSILSKKVAKKTETIIFDGEDKTLKILTTNQYGDLRSRILDKLGNKGYKFDFYYTDQESIKTALKRYNTLQKRKEKKEKKVQHHKKATGTQAIELIKKIYKNQAKYTEKKFIKEIIRLSFQSGASDLHFQPEQDGIHLRLRKDGVLSSILTFSHQEFRKYMMKLKYMAGVKLNVSETPQDGRFDFTTYKDDEQYEIDVRVSFMPGLRGESIVMRFLDSSEGIMSFSQLGFWGNNLEHLENNIKKHNGMILVTGPTGSGKTSTLYSILNKLNDSTKKIITLENPVEFEFPGIQQSQINTKKDYTYAKGLKAILRQDPDIIMLGEIRDKATAQIAIHAALTGHLVLSTLHTNSAIKAISRLINMGVKPYMLAPCLNLIIGQRLLIRLHSCNTYQKANLAEKEEIKKNIQKIQDAKPRLDLDFDGKIHKPIGCKDCNDTGYKGRMAVMETFNIDNDIQDLILKDKSNLDLYSQARQKGYLTMKEDGYIKMLRGETSLEEIRRIL